jgi:DNA-binding CsgD family transcriptional regulator
MLRTIADDLGISPGNASNLAGEAYKRLGTDNLVASFVVLGWLKLP